MNCLDLWNCTEVLLGLLCYEAQRNRLSPETRSLFADHLAECDYCRARFLSFKKLLRAQSDTSVYLH